MAVASEQCLPRKESPLLVKVSETLLGNTETEQFSKI